VPLHTPSGFKISKVVKSQQAQGFAGYKNKHSSNRQKFFFMQNLHDFNETHSAS